MASSGRLPADRADLVSAARAAASWAQARRATWTLVPLAVLAPAPIAKPATTSVRTAPSKGTQIAGRARDLGTAVGPWLTKIAVAAAAVAAVATGGPYLWKMVTTSKPRVTVAAPRRGPAAIPPSPTTNRKPTGSLRVNSTPPGAQVSVDGKARGITPLTLTDLAVGRHSVELKGEGGTIQRTVTVAANRTADVDESIFSGWVAVYLPFEITVSEGGRALLLDDRNQVMLPPGRHTLRLSNRALAFEVVREVNVQPGVTTTLAVTPPQSTMTVTASEPAEVWLDGARVGVTPVSARAVELGTHDLVVRRAAGGDRRFTVTVTVNPFTLNVDFSKPAG